MKVVYGHTDSIYVQIDSVESAQEKILEIQDYVRESFPNEMGLEQHPVVLEFEKYFSSLGVGTVKNRNAGLVSWEDGIWLDKPKFTMTGFTAKRISETQFAKELQTDILKKWVNAESENEIVKFLFETYSKVLNGKVPFEQFVKRSRLKENRFTVKCPECKSKYSLKECLTLPHKVCSKCATGTSKFTTLEGKKPSIGSGIAGVLYAWEHENKTFDDNYLSLKVIGTGTFTHPLTHETKVAEYVAGTEMNDFKNYMPDWRHYAEQVVSKAEPVFDSMGWDISSIRNGKIQKKLEEWF